MIKIKEEIVKQINTKNQQNRILKITNRHKTIKIFFKKNKKKHTHTHKNTHKRKNHKKWKKRGI
jgi:hypothetical protein